MTTYTSESVNTFSHVFGRFVSNTNKVVITTKTKDTAWLNRPRFLCPTHIRQASVVFNTKIRSYRNSINQYLLIINENFHSIDGIQLQIDGEWKKKNETMQVGYATKLCKNRVVYLLIWLNELNTDNARPSTIHPRPSFMNTMCKWVMGLRARMSNKDLVVVYMINDDILVANKRTKLTLRLQIPECLYPSPAPSKICGRLSRY